MEEIIGIYSIINNVNGKRYIGQTTNFPKRKKQHKKRLCNAEYDSYSKLYPAIQKYGWNNFSFEWLESCSKENLNDKEMYWINFFDTYKNGYNATTGGANPIPYWLGKKRSEKTKQKIKSKNTGKKHSLSTIQKIKKANVNKPKKYLQGRWKRVVCMDTGISYDAILIACQDLGVTQSAMHRHLKRQNKKIKGFTFSYGVETIPFGSKQDIMPPVEAHRTHQGDDIVRAIPMVKVWVNDKGYIQLARQSGEIKMIYAETVHENDHFEYALGLEPKLEHKPSTGDRGALTHAYAVAHYKDGGYNFMVLSKKEIEDIRVYSPMQNRDKAKGAWATEHGYKQMAKGKTIKQMSKYMPLSEEMEQGTQTDEAVFTGRELSDDNTGIREEELIHNVEELEEEPEPETEQEPQPEQTNEPEPQPEQAEPKTQNKPKTGTAQGGNTKKSATNGKMNFNQ